MDFMVVRWINFDWALINAHKVNVLIKSTVKWSLLNSLIGRKGGAAREEGRKKISPCLEGSFPFFITDNCSFCFARPSLQKQPTLRLDRVSNKHTSAAKHETPTEQQVGVETHHPRRRSISTQ